MAPVITLSFSFSLSISARGNFSSFAHPGGVSYFDGFIWCYRSRCLTFAVSEVIASFFCFCPLCHSPSKHSGFEIEARELDVVWRKLKMRCSTSASLPFWRRGLALSPASIRHGATVFAGIQSDKKANQGCMKMVASISRTCSPFPYNSRTISMSRCSNLTSAGIGPLCYSSAMRSIYSPVLRARASDKHVTMLSVDRTTVPGACASVVLMP
jgi:hypothetical protein